MDVTQETFLKVHARLASWRGEGDLRNWIARIAANEAMNQRRSGRWHVATLFEEDLFLVPDLPQETELRQDETHRALHRALCSLNPRQRLAVILRYFEGMSTRQISATLECSEGNARNILFRSLRKLRSALAGSEEALR